MVVHTDYRPSFLRDVTAARSRPKCTRDDVVHTECLPSPLRDVTATRSRPKAAAEAEAAAETEASDEVTAAPPPRLWPLELEVATRRSVFSNSVLFFSRRVDGEFDPFAGRTVKANLHFTRAKRVLVSLA